VAKVLDKRLITQILSIVEQIPVGKVTTYGQIAHLIGRERNARLVGRVLSQAGLYGKYPCQRQRGRSRDISFGPKE